MFPLGVDDRRWAAGSLAGACFGLVGQGGDAAVPPRAAGDGQECDDDVRQQAMRAGVGHLPGAQLAEDFALARVIASKVARRIFNRSMTGAGM